MQISKLAFGSGLYVRVAAKWFFAAVAVLFAPWLRAGLTNPGFELGPAGMPPPAPWVTQVYKNTGVTIYPPQFISDLGLIAGGVANTVIVNNAAGPGSQADLALGTPASLRWPLFGNQSAVVNGPDSSDANTTGAHQNVNVLSQTMTIQASDVDPSVGQIHIRFSVAPVIQYAGHLPQQEAYTFVEVLNLTRSNQQLFHAFYNYNYDSFDVWQSVGSAAPALHYYTDWQAIDVSPGPTGLAIGDVVKVTLVAAGCALGSHEAHLYVDSSAQASGLSVAGTAPTAYAPGTITYTYFYGNHAQTSASGVVIDVTTPPQLTFLAVTPPAGATCIPPPVGSSGTITCTFTDPLPAGAQGGFTTTFNVPANTTSPIHLSNYDIHSSAQAETLLGTPLDTLVLFTTTTALSSNTNPATIGQSVKFVAAVTGQSPTFTVTFNDGATAICTAVALSNGSAACSTSALSAGSHSITAVYNGDAKNAASTSNTLTQQVDKNPTTTSLATNCMTTFVENQPFTMTASVSGAAPTGGVNFATQDNLVVCANVALSSGSVSCTTNLLTVAGSATEQAYSLTANYGSDPANASSSSAAITVTALKASDVVFRNGLEVDLASCPVE